MLNIHSFLQKVKKPMRKLFKNNIGKYKTRMAVIAYAMTTVLFILSPDYIYGKSNIGVEVYVQAETIPLSAVEIEEETANEAIIRTNQTKSGSSDFILFNLTTDNSPMGYNEQETLKQIEEGKIQDKQVLSATVNAADSETVEKDSKTEDKDSKTKETDSKADSKQVGAVAEEKVDSSSTTEKTTQDTADTNQETEKSATQNTKKVVIDLSSKNVEILQRIVEAEATGETIKGKILVANVILNRVNSDKFPNTVEEVVFQQDQFSPIDDNRYWSVEITEDSIAAVERVMQGEDYSQGALYFSARSRANSTNMRWFDNNLVFLFEYGGHEFFTE